MSAVTKALHDELTGLRRELHKIAELGFTEYETSDRICRALDRIGIDYQRGLAGTGIVASLRAGAGKRCIALRADIDALPITETSTSAHRSGNDGVMHACGHDGHTTMLLGAAQVLKQRARFDGTVHFIFQPAEEHGKGALKMIEDGLFELHPCDVVYGMHNMPWLEVGKFATRPGPIMAAEDNFEIRIVGRGGHAAIPHAAKDALTVAASIITELQTIVSRNIDPLQGGVVSCTEILTDGTTNVIPGEVTIKGDTRSFLPEVSELIEARMGKIVSGLCGAHDMEHRLDYTRVFLSTINAEAESRIAAEVARSLVGAENVDGDCAPMMASEDFAAMLREKPGNYIFIGNKGRDGTGATMLHNPAYDFNDETIPYGVDYWVKLVERELPEAV